MKFLFSDVVLYLSKSNIQSCIEYCCNDWAGDSNVYLNILDRLEKRVTRAVGPTLTLLNPLLAQC